MRMGILETSAPPPSLSAFGSYSAKFRGLLGEGSYDHRIYDVRGGELPDPGDPCPAYLITGSASGVYDGDPCIAEL